MDLPLSQLSKKDIYGWMTQLVVPRPIAWVLSLNDTGTHNLAPFSYFNAVSSDPPVVSISIGKKRDGSPKDTFQNIHDRQHFTVHIPCKHDLDPMVKSSAPLEKNESEVDHLGLNLEHKQIHVEGHDVRYAYLPDQAITMFGSYYKHLTIGSQFFVLGTIHHIIVSDTILSNGQVDWDQFSPLARLGNADYTSVDTVFSKNRT